MKGLARAVAVGCSIALFVDGAALGLCAAPARCATATTVVWIDTAGDAAAGSVYYPLPFSACSRPGPTYLTVGAVSPR
jgi:hypothetical protein